MAILQLLLLKISGIEFVLNTILPSHEIAYLHYLLSISVTNFLITKKFLSSVINFSYFKDGNYHTN